MKLMNKENNVYLDLHKTTSWHPLTSLNWVRLKELLILNKVQN